jgi:hypothetical protein
MAQGPKTYQLFGDEDGWSSIEEAQNAAAARALFGLHKAALTAAAAAAAGKGGAAVGGSSAEDVLQQMRAVYEQLAQVCA